MDFSKIKNPTGLGEFALARLITVNGGWAWFESVCDALQDEAGWQSEDIDQLIKDMETALPKWEESL